MKALLRIASFLLASSWLVVLGPQDAAAQVNRATGGIAGIDNGTLAGGDGTGDAQLSLTSQGLSLIKQARDSSGTVLSDGSNVDAGQEIYFVLYVDNPTSFSANDIRITDVLDEAQFAYVAGSLEQTIVASGSGDAAIWAGVWTGLSDASGDDAASAQDTGGPASADRITIGAVAAQPNQAVDVSGTTLKAFRFRVTVN